MDELLTASVSPSLENANMVDSERIESGIQDDGSSGVVVKKVASAVIDNRLCAKKRDKGKLGYTSEELEVFNKRVKFEASGSSDVSMEIPASFEQVDPMIESPNLTANFPDIVPPLRVALDWLSLCDAKRDLCKGSSNRSKEIVENEYALAQSLVHAETLMELVRTRDELKTAKSSLKAMDDEVIKLKNQITVMKNELKDAAQIYSEDTIMKHVLLARIVMMMESPEATAYWNVKEEIETFKLKFPDSNLEEYGVFVESSLVSK